MVKPSHIKHTNTNKGNQMNKKKTKKMKSELKKLRELAEQGDQSNATISETDTDQKEEPKAEGKPLKTKDKPEKDFSVVEHYADQFDKEFSLVKYFKNGNISDHPYLHGRLNSETSGDPFKGAYELAKVIDALEMPDGSDNVVRHLVPGFTGIFAEAGAGKTTAAKAIYSDLLEARDANPDVAFKIEYLAMGEPESSMPYSLETLLETIVDMTENPIDKPSISILLVDSLKNFWSDPILNSGGATASGGVNENSYQALSTLTALCLNANVMLVAVINPLFIKPKDVLKAITSSISSLWTVSFDRGRDSIKVNGLSRDPVHDTSKWSKTDELLSDTVLVTRRTSFEIDLVYDRSNLNQSTEDDWERTIIKWFPGSFGDNSFGV